VVGITVAGTHKAEGGGRSLPPGMEDDPFFQFFKGIPGFGQGGPRGGQGGQGGVPELVRDAQAAQPLRALDPRSFTGEMLLEEGGRLALRRDEEPGRSILRHPRREIGTQPRDRRVEVGKLHPTAHRQTADRGAVMMRRRLKRNVVANCAQSASSQSGGSPPGDAAASTR
jgi:hypothetical protein